MAAAEKSLRVLLADEDKTALDRLAVVIEAELGHTVTPYAVDVAEATLRIAREDPELAIVVVHGDEDHALALISESVESASGPVVVLCERKDIDLIVRAAEEGIAAWIPSRDPSVIQGAIEVAMRRHAESERLQTTVDQLKSAIERRGVIERAKGILMERHQIGDRAAFEMLRRNARDQRRRVVSVAAELLSDRTPPD